ncbi:Adenylate kinase family protein [Ectocarpus siliculosus]|uniref:Adenylate kinase family protein n=1 Tax=Ectocarpus siliculosus TaxID=2880 RepID=D8LDL6_ECTSI|nr:Adenylate kinase family protein [Ectocarpus siliculosus]|eukprot:CBN74091.1 Adenylate kinase family protein [Ectocarpus siliculosus]
MTTEPYRDVESQEYKSKSNQPWQLKYHDIKTRRDAADARSKAYDGPPLKIIVTGKPSSGKGSISPMLSRAYRGVYIASGNLLRSEAQAETSLGRRANEFMSRGEMLPSEVVLSLVTKRLAQRDCAQNGWILDGFPRTRGQAADLGGEDIVPDLIVMLERPDGLVKEFSLGRCTDPTTGVIYHPKFSPPPPDVVPRLTWRTDDTKDVIEKRLKQYAETSEGIREAYEDVPRKVVDSSKSDLDTFAEVCDFVEEVAKAKAERLGPEGMREILEMGDIRMSDVQRLTEEEQRAFEEQPTLLAAAQRCNRYVASDFTPVYVEDVKVGAVSSQFASELNLFSSGDAVMYRASVPGAGPVGMEGPAYVLAPYAASVEERTRVVSGLVQGLVDTGAIPKGALRNELQDVRSATGKLSVTGDVLFRLERAAMIHFGVPSYGVHLNGYVKATDTEPMRVWIGVRSVSKATYPGMWDQMVAGGQPAGMGFKENMQKECEEEASLPSSLSCKIQPTGQVSYRYGTRKGLSTKFLCVFDLEVPEDFVPYNGDGEVEEFILMPVEEALKTIKTDLARWKPNCALVMIDFALRHGFLDPDHPDYLELVHQLRTGHTASTF